MTGFMLDHMHHHQIFFYPQYGVESFNWFESQSKSQILFILPRIVVNISLLSFTATIVVGFLLLSF